MFQEVGVVHGAYLEVVVCLLALDPADRLFLGINAVGESAGLCGQDSVLDRKLIRWETFRVPPKQSIQRKVAKIWIHFFRNKTRKSIIFNLIKCSQIFEYPSLKLRLTSLTC